MFKKRFLIEGWYGPIARESHLSANFGDPWLIGGPESMVGKAQGEEWHHHNQKKDKVS